MKVKMPTAGLLVIKERKLLLAFSNNKKAFYLPGGKTDPHETSRQSLIREIKEELNIEITEAQLQFYMHVSAPAFGEANDIIMEQDCFLYDLKEAPEAAAEIGALEYFDSVSYPLQPQQVPGVIMVIERLKKDGLID